MTLNVSIDDGKYTIQQDEAGNVTLLRYGEPWDASPLYAKMLTAIGYELDELRAKLAPPPTRVADDGSTRMQYYGAGEQPWDTAKRLGWAPEFAAANVLKYLRRTKEPEKDFEKAKWYYTELLKLENIPSTSRIITDLLLALNNDELVKLEHS